MKKIIIAIDGPAGSGKSTTARHVAQSLGYVYIDTGAMYRAVTLGWLRSGLELSDENVADVLNKLKIELKQSDDGQKTFLNGEDVSDAIRLPEVSRYVSPVSAMSYVRSKLVDEQRRMGMEGGIVMDGRDIGTVVFPYADLKIYLVASISARAERRALELKNKGIEFDVEEIKNLIRDRDTFDSSRPISPLTKAPEAVEVDTSNLTIEEQVDLILGLAQQIINN